MKRLVRPSAVNGVVVAPASKSVAQRVLAMATMAQGSSHIFNIGKSADVMAALDVCRCLGAKIDGDSEHLIIHGGILNPSGVVNCGESGLGVRMFSAIASAQTAEFKITGEGSLLNRPMEFVVNGLQQMGARCCATNGRLPIRVRGPLVGGKIMVDGSQSSQALTGLLMAAVLAEKDTLIHVDNLKSTPYIDLTISLMRQFGVEVKNDNYQTFAIKHGQHYEPCSINVEGDWSGAAFWLVAGAIAGRVEVKNLDLQSSQADVAIIQALRCVEANVMVKKDSVLVEHAGLQPFDFDATACPDLFPPLVALAAHCNGTSRLTGVGRLRIKESDRAATIAEEFGKMGISIGIDGDVMLVKGGELKSAQVSSHNDHRIAMACAIAALAGMGEVEVDNAEAVNKSYPEFWEEMKKLLIIESKFC